MLRAAIFIGVDQTGGLRRLRDAAGGAKRMHAWALTQGVTSTLITDEDGRVVTPDDIFNSIKKFLDGPGVDQRALATHRGAEEVLGSRRCHGERRCGPVLRHPARRDVCLS